LVKKKKEGMPLMVCLGLPVRPVQKKRKECPSDLKKLKEGLRIVLTPGCFCRKPIQGTGGEGVNVDRKIKRRVLWSKKKDRSPVNRHSYFKKG